MARTPKAAGYICDILKEKHALSASALVAELAARGLRFNKTSVYRSLDKLLEQGRICRQTFNSSEVVYELRQATHHDHFVCEACEQITHLECVLALQNLPLGVEPRHHHITVFGICEQCHANKVRESNTELASF